MTTAFAAVLLCVSITQFGPGGEPLLTLVPASWDLLMLCRTFSDPCVSSVTNWTVSNFNSHVGSWCPCCPAGGRDTAEQCQQTGQQFYNQNKINILITDCKLLPTSKRLRNSFPLFSGSDYVRCKARHFNFFFSSCKQTCSPEC